MSCKDPTTRDSLLRQMSTGKTLVATIHLPPLPGSPRAGSFRLFEFREFVREEARKLADSGFHALVVENFGDAPFFAGSVEPHTLSLLTVAAIDARETSKLPVGVNVLRNDARGALGVALASGSSFIRVNVLTGVTATDQGIIEGGAAEILRYRKSLEAETLIWADVNVKHAKPLGQSDWRYVTEETLDRGLADAVIVSGPTTSRPPELKALEAVKEAAGLRPVILGSGFDPKDANTWLKIADGIIVSSALREGGKPGAPLDTTRLKSFEEAVSSYR